MGRWRWLIGAMKSGLNTLNNAAPTCRGVIGSVPVVFTVYFLVGHVLTIPDLNIHALTFPIPHIAINNISIACDFVVSQHPSIAFPALNSLLHADNCSLIIDRTSSLTDVLRCFAALFNCWRCSALMRKFSSSAGCLSVLTVLGCAMSKTVAPPCDPVQDLRHQRFTFGSLPIPEPSALTVA